MCGETPKFDQKTCFSNLGVAHWLKFANSPTRSDMYFFVISGPIKMIRDWYRKILDYTFTKVHYQLLNWFRFNLFYVAIIFTISFSLRITLNHVWIIRLSIYCTTIIKQLIPWSIRFTSITSVVVLVWNHHDCWRILLMQVLWWGDCR